MSDKRIDFEGISFTIPSDAKKLPVKAIEAWEADLMVHFAKHLLGETAWKQFLARDPNMEDFERLSSAIGEQYGFESVGESSGSESSSEKTSGPSNTTSSTSTDSTSPASASAQ